MKEPRSSYRYLYHMVLVFAGIRVSIFSLSSWKAYAERTASGEHICPRRQHLK